MRNGIKSIYEYIDRDHYEARITFCEPCFPKLYAPDSNSDFWELRWTDRIPTEEGFSRTKWCMAYNDDLKQIITLEDGTEMVVTGENREEDLQKLQEYIDNGYSTGSELSKAARLLDDEMQYEI